jgi:hypothetical protein
MHPEPLDDFDRIERVTRLVGRSALVGFPVWILLLALLPLTGMGVLPCLLGATVLTAAAVVVVERRRARRATAAGDAAATGDHGAPPGRRRPMSAPAAVALTLGAVVLLAYVVLVIRAA